MKHICIIPVKHTSDRVHSKNFREFFNRQSLLEIKIRQVIESGCYEKIYVSSDSEEAKITAEKFGVDFLKRDSKFCNNITSWSDVIFNVVSSIPEEDAVISWVHTTSPLFSDFSKCIKSYEDKVKEGFLGLVAVKKLSEFIVGETGIPKNYNWGVWHPYSQDLEKLYAINGALFVAKKNEMLKNRYVISRKPFLYVCKDLDSIDVDTEEDFELAQVLYNYKLNKA